MRDQWPNLAARFQTKTRIMNKFLALLLLSALSVTGADSLPYHPSRKIGTNYYDLRPLYTWRAKLLPANSAYLAARQKAEESGAEADKRGPGYPESSRRILLQTFSADLRKAEAAMDKLHTIAHDRPMMEWAGGDVWESFTVEQVWNPNLLLLQVQYTKSSAKVVLKGYPLQSAVTDGEGIQFFALRTGIYQWTNRSAGTVQTLPLFDYGITYTPMTKAKP